MGNTPAQNQYSQSHYSNTANEVGHKLYENYLHEMHEIDELSHLEKKDIHYGTQMSFDKAHDHYCTSRWSWGACGYTTTEHTNAQMVNQIHKDQQRMQAIQAKKAKIERDLEAQDPGHTLAHFIGSLNGLTEGKTSDSPTCLFGNEHQSSDEKTLLRDLMQLIRDQVDTDSGLQEKNGRVEKLSINQAMGLEDEQDDMTSSLSHMLSHDQLFTYEKKGQDEETYHSYSALEREAGKFGYNNLNLDALKTLLAEKAQERLYHAIEHISKEISSISGDLTVRAFQPIMEAVESLMKQVQKILSNPHLSPEAKREKLAALLQLMLGYLEAALQIAQSIRSQNKQKIEKADLQAQKVNFEKLKTNGAILSEVQKQEKSVQALQDVMGKVQIITTVFFALTGTIGVAIALTTMTVLQQTKVLSHLATDLDSHSKVGGKLAEMGIVMAATLVGSAGIDLIVEKMTSAAVEEAAQAAAQTTTSIADDVADNKEDVATTFKEEVKKVAEIAGRDAAREFYNTKSMATAISSTAKAILRKLISCFVDSTEETLDDNALQRVLRKALSEVQGQDVLTDAREYVAQNVSSAAKKAAEELTSALNKSEEELTPDAVKNASNKLMEDRASNPGARAGLKASAWAGIYTASSTDLWMNIFAPSNNPKHGQAKKTIVAILQALIEMLAMMKGGNLMCDAGAKDSLSSVQVLMKGGALAQVASMAVEAATNFEQAQIYKNEGKAVEGEQKVQALDAVLRTFENQDKSSGDPSSSGLSMEQKELIKQAQAIARDVSANTDAASHLLASRAV